MLVEKSAQYTIYSIGFPTPYRLSYTHFGRRCHHFLKNKTLQKSVEIFPDSTTTHCTKAFRDFLTLFCISIFKKALKSFSCVRYVHVVSSTLRVVQGGGLPSTWALNSVVGRGRDSGEFPNFQGLLLCTRSGGRVCASESEVEGRLKKSFVICKKGHKQDRKPHSPHFP